MIAAIFARVNFAANELLRRERASASKINEFNIIFIMKLHMRLVFPCIRDPHRKYPSFMNHMDIGYQNNEQINQIAFLFVCWTLGISHQMNRWIIS